MFFCLLLPSVSCFFYSWVWPVAVPNHNLDYHVNQLAGICRICKNWLDITKKKFDLTKKK